MKKKIAVLLLALFLLFNILVVFIVYTLIRTIDNSAAADNSFSRITRSVKKLMPYRNPQIQFDDLHHSVIYLNTSDNHTIETMLFGTPEEFSVSENNNDTPIVIFLHGYGHPINNSEKFRIDFLRRHNVPVIAPHFRGYARSSGKYTYIGVNEYKDAEAVLKYINTNFPGKKIIIFGISMGAASGLKAAVNAEYNNIAGFILEGCYHSLQNAVENRIALTGAPRFVIYFLKFWAKNFFGLDVSGNIPVDYAPLVKQPVLFIAGSQDAKTDPQKMKELFSRFETKYKYIEIENAEHADVYEKNSGLYEKETIDFIYKIK